jgi:conjugative transposon TraK protein
MFHKAKHIDSAFRQIRSFSIVLIVCSTGLSIYSLFQNQRILDRSQERIYILANGKALEAFGSDRKDNIPVEARDHIRTFHLFFFSLDPDEKVITANLSRALYLADGSAKREYDNLKENGFYSNLISGNISQQLEVDSIEVNTDSYPYYFRFMAKEKLIRTTSIVTRSLITQGWLRSVGRSDNNPHGFLIERWQILENNDLKIQNR